VGIEHRSPPVGISGNESARSLLFPDDNQAHQSKDTEMATLVDYMLGLFSNPETAEAFLKNPDDALGAAGLADVSTDQLQAVAASVAPTGLTLSGLDPIEALARAVSDHHGIDTGLGAPESGTLFQDGS
jgi:hypothetical protein